MAKELSLDIIPDLGSLHLQASPFLYLPLHRQHLPPLAPILSAESTNPTLEPLASSPPDPGLPCSLPKSTATGSCLSQASLAIPRPSPLLLPPNSSGGSCRENRIEERVRLPDCWGERFLHSRRLAQRADTCPHTALWACPLHHPSRGQCQVPVYSLGRIPNHCFQIKTNLHNCN